MTGIPAGNSCALCLVLIIVNGGSDNLTQFLYDVILVVVTCNDGDSYIVVIGAATYKSLGNYGIGKPVGVIRPLPI